MVRREVSLRDLRWEQGRVLKTTCGAREGGAGGGRRCAQSCRWFWVFAACTTFFFRVRRQPQALTSTSAQQPTTRTRVRPVQTFEIRRQRGLQPPLRRTKPPHNNNNNTVSPPARIDPPAPPPQPPRHTCAPRQPTRSAAKTQIPPQSSAQFGSAARVHARNYLRALRRRAFLIPSLTTVPWFPRQPRHQQPPYKHDEDCPRPRRHRCAPANPAQPTHAPVVVCSDRPS